MTLVGPIRTVCGRQALKHLPIQDKILIVLH